MPSWIAVAVDAIDDPEVVSLATDLGISSFEMLGHLVTVWGCMAKHARRGDLSSVTNGSIESWARWSGAPNLFATRFREVFAPRGRVKNWDKWNGKQLRQAELSTKRKRKWREQKERERNASATRGGTGTETGRHAENFGTRPDQTRPNQKNKLHTRVDDPQFDAAWNAYPRRPNNSRTKARDAWNTSIKRGASPDAMLQGTKAYAAYVERERIEPRFIKQGSTFYGPKEHWLDDYGPVETPFPPMYLPNGEFNPEAAAALGVAMPR